ncbi:outer membrane protein transport protein (OMPP1/FadL/TodX) [Gillisia sp. Hel_I_86]|uniref:OmpP1/FadL family transporter n=1 Tax=Gillisia sp. Hel_I_86 TaxID=1249981 RepID=UPI00119B14DD|nr:outer membrane protein transport protein [Gillisia sp. Hel_I_86]TVZ25695.1 outer membrane protein transport protein (OMPP1/FadL/TodX) [Gillisia sp. Hel_I_86]
MKKLYFTVIALAVMTFSQAQDITDAVRYSSDQLSGTARYRAMSGAFGALGGDLSAISINPAGSAVFLSSAATVTLSYNNRQNDTRYFNGATTNDDSDVYFDQAGAVLVFNSTNENTPWKRFTLGVNYSQNNTFDDSFLAQGTSSSSIDNYFLEFANGVPLELLETMDNETITDLYLFLGENEGFGAQQAFLGFQGFIIDPVSNDLDNTSYTSNVASGSFDQRYSYRATGLNGKFAFNFATKYQDFLHLGINLNAHFLNYDRATRLVEQNSNAGSETNEIIFSNNLSTSGNGFSLQLGGIANVTDNVRLGLTYDTPTWFSIEEQASQRLETFSDEFDERVIVDPNVINVYPNYRLKTPGKLTGSLAVLFGDTGLISFDYSYKDFSNTELRPSNDPEFEFQNNLMSDNLKVASTYKLGGEYRIENWSLRGGYRFEESPYKNETTLGDLNGYSAGVGYNFGAIKADVSYDHSSRTDNPQLYQVGLVNTANIQRDFSSIVLSLSFGI